MNITTDGNTDIITTPGQAYAFAVEGTFGSGTITLLWKNEAGNFVQFANCTLTSSGKRQVIVPGKAVRVTLSGSSGASINVDFVTCVNGAGQESSSETSPIIVGGGLIGSISTFARPGDTTAYAANDAVANATSSPVVQSFSNTVWSDAGSGIILSARGFTDLSTMSATLRMHLYYQTPTAINDNAAFTLLWANRAKRIGFIDFGGWQTGGSGSDAASCLIPAINLPFTCDTASKTLYYMLEARSAFTPGNAQNFHFQLQIARP